MDEYHYKHKDKLMTPSELELFMYLVELLGKGFFVFPQVHLGTIIKPKTKWDYRWRKWRRVYFFGDKYSVDFVICNPDAATPVLAIELDDRSHLQAKRKKRDLFVERALLEAELPLIRIKPSDSKDYVESRIKSCL